MAGDQMAANARSSIPFERDRSMPYTALRIIYFETEKLWLMT